MAGSPGSPRCIPGHPTSRPPPNTPLQPPQAGERCCATEAQLTEAAAVIADAHALSGVGLLEDPSAALQGHAAALTAPAGNSSERSRRAGGRAAAAACGGQEGLARAPWVEAARTTPPGAGVLRAWRLPLGPWLRAAPPLLPAGLRA